MISMVIDYKPSIEALTKYAGEIGHAYLSLEACEIIAARYDEDLLPEALRPHWRIFEAGMRELFFGKEV